MKNNFQCLSQRHKQTRDKCLTELKASAMPEADLYILHGPELFSLWVAKQKSQGFAQSAISQKLEGLGLPELAQNVLVTSLSLVNQFGGQVIDVKTMGILALDMHRGGSILGKYEITQKGAKSYISFKGNHKLRTVIKGTRYLSTNTKMLTLGIGQQGLKASARGGVLITVVFSVSHHTLELVLKKDYLITNWVVDVATDITIASVAAVFGYVVGTLAISSISVVVVPVLAGFAVAFYVQGELNNYESHYRIKERLVESLNQSAQVSVERDMQLLKRRIDQIKAVTSMNHSTYQFF
ncbi:hypothetical protein M0C34_04725 [Agarivorans sp. TSD2052]|uniref:hypothetical protein n=1 Tax=Agarivorans sp. TSD2052 TaxID=2937286 RepID=UPI00200C7B64|nr:hypothetical protein [Agarivorans sp. TSD2052]UPW19586.1 hypothetical protein M0C34_04725 [Agarivorans sp. TSD2052]